MPRLDAQRREAAAAFRQSRAVENELTPNQARLFVRCLQVAWQVPPIAWGQQELTEQFADARRLLHAARIFRDLDGENSPEATDCYRRAAELLEWLSRASDRVTRDVPLSFARRRHLPARWPTGYGHESLAARPIWRRPCASLRSIPGRRFGRCARPVRCVLERAPRPDWSPRLGGDPSA